MSTILKALKQIDQTAPPEDLQSWPPKIDTKETVKTRIQKIRLNRKVYLSTLLMLMIVAAVWLVYSQKDLLLAKIFPGRISQNDTLASAGSSENGPIYQAKIYPSSSKQTFSSSKRDDASRKENKRADLKSEPTQIRTDKQSRQLPKISARQKTDKNPIFSAAGKKESPPMPSSSASRISPSQMADSNRTVQSRTRAAAAVPPKKTRAAVKQVQRSYRRLDESKLTLQAIAWSKVAAQRIAVINGHIVREGESVEGFSVTQIRQDDIIVNDGTESWRVEFKLK
ncbi:MAG: general secretion pathway protein GspB [Desulfobacterales bacterium]